MPRRYQRKFNVYASKKNASQLMKNKQVKAVVKEELLANEKRTVEKKFHDTFYTANPDNGGIDANTLVRLSSIGVGTSDSLRVGDKCKPISVSVSFWAKPSSTNFAYDSVIRLILFQWHPDSGRDPPSLNEILMGTRNGLAQMPLSPMNHDGRAQFSILAQKTVLVGGGEDRIITGRMYSQKLRGIEFRAGGNEGLQHIYLLVVSNQTAGLTQEPEVYIDTRVNFTDS